jgi:hypothetical protein
MRFERESGDRRPNLPVFRFGTSGDHMHHLYVSFWSGHTYEYSTCDGCFEEREPSMPVCLEWFLDHLGYGVEEDNDLARDPPATELAAAALVVFPEDDEESVNARRRLRPVSYEADAVDAVWTPEVHWRWQSPDFHGAVRALLMSHLRLSKTPLTEGTATHLGCLPQEVIPLIVSQLGEVWVEPRVLVMGGEILQRAAVPDEFWVDDNGS